MGLRVHRLLGLEVYSFVGRASDSIGPASVGIGGFATLL